MDLSEIKKIRSRQITALTKNGIDSVEALAMSVPRQLEEINGISSKASKNLVWDAREMLDMSAFTSAVEIREEFDHITTGSEEFDNILGGGISTGRITEVFGAFKSGKTCLSHTACVSAQLPNDHGGVGGSVLFLDTENTFSKAKIKRIARRFGIDEDEALRNIFHARIYSTDHQLQMTREAEGLIKEKNVKLLVIDSLMALMRSEYVGIGMLAQRQQVLNRLIHDLSRMAETYDIAILLTNQVATQMKGHYSSNDAIGGNIVAHGCHFRVQFKTKGFSANSSLQRRAIIVDAPDLPPEECEFYITEAGVADDTDIKYPEITLKKARSAKKKGKKKSKGKSKGKSAANSNEKSKNASLSIEQLEAEFSELKMAGFEDKYDELIEFYEKNKDDSASGAVYSGGLTNDFKQFLEEKGGNKSSDIKDPLAAIEQRLSKA
ncbi:MAG TPA: DNA repair and recombination protein RadA [Patescibacteria group bacterium]|nr:DNA repair and recombination protein RadA [Patescibacteria group bacterium]